MEAFGVSFDGFYGFPVFKEVSSTLIVCTAPGYHVGCIQFVKKSNSNRTRFLVKSNQQKTRRKRYGSSSKAPI